MAKIIHFGVCLDNKDPLMSGRIRAVRDSDFKSMSAADYDEAELSQILEGNIAKATKEGGDPQHSSIETLKWSKDDPHVIPPFLPLFLNVIPAKNENVKLILYQSGDDSQNIEYLGPSPSQPTKFPYEHYSEGRLFTSRGVNVEESPKLRNSTVSKGCFALENSIALNGRLNSDLIFGNRQLVLRAGKFHKSEEGQDFPRTNYTQSILQIDNFETKLTLEKTTEPNPVTKDSDLKYLIQYEITNWNDPVAIASEIFNGYITLYQVTSDSENQVIQAGQTHLTTPLEEITESKDWLIRQTFLNYSLSGTTNLINQFLQDTDTGNHANNTPYEHTTPAGEYYEKEFKPEINPLGESTPSSDELLRPYPLYYRPNLEFVKELQAEPTSPTTQQKATKITEKIRLTGVDTKFYGLAFDKKERPVPTQNEKKEVDVPVYESKTQGISSIFSDEILLFSYAETIPGKGTATPIIDSFNNSSHLTGDNIGLDQTTLVKTSRDNMEPLVRGDQLLKLLREIWDFIENHEHGLPGTAPFPETKEGDATTESVGTSLSNAEKTLLNQHIKIN